MKTKKILGIALAVCMTMGLTTVPAMAEDKKTGSRQKDICIW